MKWLAIFCSFLVLFLIFFDLKKVHMPSGGTTLQRWNSFYDNLVKDGWKKYPRVYFVTNSLKVLREKPMFGHGYGSFRFVYPKYYEVGNTEPQHFKLKGSAWLMHPHNEFAYQIFEGGLFGFFFFFLFFAVAGFFIFRRIHDFKKPSEKYLATTLWMSLVNVLIVLQLDPVMLHSLMRLALIFILGLSYSLIRSDLKNFKMALCAQRPFVKYVFMGMFFCVGLICVSYNVSSYFFKSAMTSHDKKTKESSFKKMTFLSPWSFDCLFNSGTFYRSTEDSQRAEDFLARAYEQFPYSGHVMYELGWTYYQNKKYEQAFAVASRLKSLYPFFNDPSQAPMENFYFKIQSALDSQNNNQ